MATHKSAEKRARQSVRRNARNATTLAKVRTWEKKLRKAVEQKDLKLAQDVLKDFTSVVTKAAQKGMVHMKTASRKVSRLSSTVSRISKN